MRTVITKIMDSSEIERNISLYKPAFDHITYHEEDPNLDTITIKLPSPPPLNEIENYGLHPRDQMWHPPVIPPRLLSLQKELQEIDKIRDFLIQHQVDYEDEIKFMEREWHRRHNGYWLFIFGRPYYMVGWHYVYCGYWMLDCGLPKWYDRDWMAFHFFYWAYKDTALPNGTNLGRRVCFGVNYPKMRREGATYKGALINFLIITSFFKVRGGIQSMDGPSGKKAYLIHTIAPWRSLPFFFKPFYTGSDNPIGGLYFEIPPKRGKMMAYIESGLGGDITWADSAGRGWFDGSKLFFYHEDECGKTEVEDVNARWRVIRKCLAMGLKIHGFSLGTSTVGEMSEKGGLAFFNVCKGSHWSQRNRLGQTKTGKYNLFIPSWYGYDPFIDKFGMSIIDDPKESDLWRIPIPTRDDTGRLIGAKTAIEINLNDKIEDESPEAMENYEEELRLLPREFADCFITKGQGSGLNLKKIVERIKILQFEDEKLCKRVTYRWENDIKDSRVIQIPDNDGYWKISLELPPNRSNQKQLVDLWDGVNMIKAFMPMFPNIFTASGDPTKFRKTQGARESLAAFTIFWNRDKELDPDDKPIDQWESYRNVLTYCRRPATPEEYAEQCIMACVYWGAPIFPEINVPILWDHFVQRGYAGYLKYIIDLTGRKKKTPGFYAKGEIQQRIFSKHKTYIELHCHRERHIEILQDCKKIRGIEFLHDHDLFVSVGGGYIGSEYQMPELGAPAYTSDIRTYFPYKRY